jgi:regulator of replication initiation timing
VKAALVTDGPTATPDPAMKKQLDNLVREVEGLYAQMDELLHKNTILEQKLSNNQQRPFDLPKPAYNEPKAEIKAPEAKPVTPQVTTPEINQPEPTKDTVPAFKINIPEQTTYTKLSISESEEVKKDEFTDETVDLPAITFFLAKPDRAGFFWNDEVNRSFVPGRSLFALSLYENDLRKGQFEFVKSPAQEKLALENPDLYLRPVCDIEGDPETGTHLETDLPGTIVLNGDQWVLVKKAKLRVV